MKNWKIPVTWQVYGYVNIEANTLAEALEIARDEHGVIPLPTGPEYIDRSWDLSDESEETIRACYNNNQNDDSDLLSTKGEEQVNK